MSAPLSVETHNQVAVVTLDRPQARNALDLSLCHSLTETFRGLDADPSAGAVLVRGAGLSFCAGADLKERRGKDESWVRQRRKASFEAYRSIAACRLPVIALVHGAVVGSGGEIAMSCDFVYAAEDTTFRFPEAHWGTVGATQRLQRIVGRGKAKELLFTGERIDANQAERLGLVQRVLPSASAYDTALETAHGVGSAPRLSLRLTKQAIDGGAEVTLEQGIAVEMRAIEHSLAADEWRDGITRFASDTGTDVPAPQPNSVLDQSPAPSRKGVTE